MTHLALPLLLIAISGCAATTVQYAQIGPVRPRPVVAAPDVAVLFRDPTCSFDELGMLEVQPGAYATSLQEQVDLLRVEAGKRGANAIIMLSHNDTATGHHQPIVRHAYTALAISISSCTTIGVRRRSTAPNI